MIILESLLLIIHMIMVGFISYHMGKTIVDEDGPFEIFPRIRRLMLPDSKMPSEKIPQPPLDVDHLVENLTDFQIAIQNHSSWITAWELYFDEDPTFKKTIRGTIYTILDCIYCIGPYMSFVVTMLAAIAFDYSLPMFIMTWIGSFSVHYYLAEGRDDKPL